MKKFIMILLTVLTSLTLFACADNKQSSNDPLAPPHVCPVFYYDCDTFIQDVNGVDKCFWEDGALVFNDHHKTGRQERKSATLSLQEEYDMWFNYCTHDLDFVKFFDLKGVECDADKIQVSESLNKDSHFIIKALQPCNQEKVVFIVADKTVDKNGEPRYGAVPRASRLTIMISTEE